MPSTRHVYALFERQEEARAAYKDVQDLGCDSERCSAVFHEDHIDEVRLPTRERATPEGAMKGAAIGGFVGVVLGALGGLVGLGSEVFGIGPLAAGALGGGVLAIYGAIAGGIAGGDEPDRHMRRLQHHVEHGKFLVAVETDDPELETMCERIFTQRGGRQVSF